MSPRQEDALARIDVQIADLPGAMLGRAWGTTITIDIKLRWICIKRTIIVDVQNTIIIAILITDITNSISICIGLIRVGVIETVITSIAGSIEVKISLFI